MCLSKLTLSATLAAVAVISIGSASISGQAPADNSATAVSTASPQAPAAVVKSGSFATLNRIKATPMTSSELDAVKGLHVHVIVAPSQNDQYGLTGLHLAGDVKTENNWQNLGGTDPAPVAPSYHGLCVAVGSSSVLSIPFNPAVGTQCP
jgi:hypothetical protein